MKKNILPFDQWVSINESSGSDIEVGESRISLTQNRDDLYNYLDQLKSEYGDEEILITVLFDTKNDRKSMGKFKTLLEESIIDKKRSVIPVRFILQPIPSEYKFMDLKGREEGKPLPMPSHNIIFYYKDKKILDDFVNKMIPETKKMNIWKVGFQDSLGTEGEGGEGAYGYIFQRISFGGSCLPDEEELMIKCLTPLFG